MMNESVGSPASATARPWPTLTLRAWWVCALGLSREFSGKCLLGLAVVLPPAGSVAYSYAIFRRLSLWSLGLALLCAAASLGRNPHLMPDKLDLVAINDFAALYRLKPLAQDQ